MQEKWGWSPHFISHNLLYDYKHGFTQKCPCDTQLIVTINDLAKGIYNNQQIDAVLLDFSKAFGKVPHTRLLHKLDHFAIKGTTNSCIEYFLVTYTTCCHWALFLSYTSPITPSILQGSVHVPLLFLAYINDIPFIVKSTARLWHQLQHNLDSLQPWGNDWQMASNPDKCEVIHITTKRKPLPNTYSIHGKVLNTTDHAT